MATGLDAVDRITAYYRNDGLELRSGVSAEAWLFATHPVEVEQ